MNDSQIVFEHLRRIMPDIPPRVTRLRLDIVIDEPVRIECDYIEIPARITEEQKPELVELELVSRKAVQGSGGSERAH